MINYLAYFMLVALSINLNAQFIGVDSINFYDTLKFKQNIIRKTDNQIDYVQYDEIEGNLKKIDYFDSKNRIVRDKIWRDTLIRETEYEYFENNQVIKRYDATNKKHLPTQLSVYFRYPELARESEISGIVEVELSYNSDCVPVSYKILNSLGYGIEEHVNKGMKLMINLANKYKVSFEKCNELNGNIKINFKLE